MTKQELNDGKNDSEEIVSLNKKSMKTKKGDGSSINNQSGMMKTNDDTEQNATFDGQNQQTNNDKEVEGVASPEDPAKCSPNYQECVARYKHVEPVYDGGPSGIIDLCRNVETDEIFVSKTIAVLGIHLIDGEPVEVKVMREMDHPHITKMIEWYFNKKKVFIIMPYTGGIDLHDLQEEMGTFSECYLKKQAMKILLALKHLHENGFIHQDIKPANVIVNPLNGDLTLIDFGMTRQYDKDRPWKKSFQCVGGTIGFAPPELHNEQKVWGPEIDVHCLGALLYYMYYGIAPYVRKDDGAKCEERIPSKEFTTLLRACLNKNPSLRPSVNEIMDSEWIQGTSETPESPLIASSWSSNTPVKKVPKSKPKSGRQPQRKDLDRIAISQLPRKKRDLAGIISKVDTSCPKSFYPRRRVVINNKKG